MLRIGAAKSKRRAIKVGTIQCTNKTKLEGHSKINEQIQSNLYAWKTFNSQVVQSPISNYCLKFMFDDQTEPQLVPKLLLQVYVIEVYNSLVSDTNYGGLKDARYEDYNIIISDYTFRSLLPPQLKNISARYKVVCGFDCCISAKIIHSSLLSWSYRYLKKT